MTLKTTEAESLATSPTSRSEQPQSPVWRSPVMWITATFLVALAILLVVAVLDGKTEEAAQETAFAEVLGNPLPPIATPDEAIGRVAPTVSAQSLTGERMQFGVDGTAVLYGFFAHWCPHCQDEVPAVTAWRESFDLADGVELVAISTGVDATRLNYPPSEWFAREGWTDPVLLDDEAGTLAAGFGLTGYPYWVAVDADGVVVGRLSGTSTVAELEAMIALLTKDL